jgi:hypothetical protein
MKSIPNYRPPSDYKRPTKTQEKVYVPVNDYPEINFSMHTNPHFLPTKLLSFTSLVPAAVLVYRALQLLTFSLSFLTFI